MTDPATIAAGLTAAQKRALLWLPADFSTIKVGMASPDQESRLYLRVMGFMAAPTPSLRRLTVLGAEVRRHLAAQREGGGDVG